jgi:MFS transporter, DHA2 family, multidrug resistance protein
VASCRQAQIIASIDDCKLFMIATLAAIPLLIVFKSRPPDHAIVVE